VSYGVPHTYPIKHSKEDTDPRPEQKERRDLEAERERLENAQYCPKNKKRIDEINERIKKLNEIIDQKIRNREYNRRYDQVVMDLGQAYINGNGDRIPY